MYTLTFVNQLCWCLYFVQRREILGKATISLGELEKWILEYIVHTHLPMKPSCNHHKPITKVSCVCEGRKSYRLAAASGVRCDGTSLERPNCHFLAGRFDHLQLLDRAALSKSLFTSLFYSIQVMDSIADNGFFDHHSWRRANLGHDVGYLQVSAILATVIFVKIHHRLVHEGASRKKLKLRNRAMRRARLTPST
ncbi:7TM GPCR domain containing protein [Operophtera brumata]|uniref:7TM GPCR domain containing protein n=1 Tax=Operophtera brumata TaxID=104452 RepID=A0A0L7L8X5_OPEBR|nr:7TM GPCR domain containing protein [Operophtera brumata]